MLIIVNVLLFEFSWMRVFSIIESIGGIWTWGMDFFIRMAVPPYWELLVEVGRVFVA